MMPERKIEKLRVLHDLKGHFKVSEGLKQELESQLPADEIQKMERFVSGFKIEDWFESIFSAMPWATLIHALDQQQFPLRSKASYQVPDFLLLVETSALSDRPLLVEVKRVPSEKLSLKVQSAQMELCEKYAQVCGIPLVYAIFWEKYKGWTLNTPDSFETKGSTRKLLLTKAFELDCGLILGDIFFMVPAGMGRIMRFEPGEHGKGDIVSPRWGRLVSDRILAHGKEVELTRVESAAVDAMIEMKDNGVNRLEGGAFEVRQSSANDSMLKLSSWITRHLALFDVEPNEGNAWQSASGIGGLTRKLEFKQLFLFPSYRDGQIRVLNEIFRKKPQTGLPPTIL